MDKSTALRRVDAGLFTRTVYVIGLAILVLQSIAKVPFALLLFRKMATNPNIVNPVIAAVLILAAVAMAYLLGGRCVAVIRHRHVLEAFVGDRKTAMVRVVGLSLLTLGLVVITLVFVSGFIVQGGGQILIAGAFAFTVPLGLALFELSRLMGFEQHALDED